VSIGKNGEPGRISVALVDGSDRELLSIDWNNSGRLAHVTKYLFEEGDELLHVFRYASDGQLVGIQDFANEDNASFDQVKGALSDPDFYETGFALPKSIAGTAIPLHAGPKP
jgi:hypothetical protein